MSKEYLELEFKNEKIQLPSEKKSPKIKKSKKPKKKLKWGLIIIILVLIYIFYNQILLYFLNYLKTNPTMYSNYLYITDQISNNTLKGYFFVSILGSLFFLLLPSEALFIYYLNSTSHNFILLILIMILGNLIGLIFNYLFGRLLGENILKLIFGEGSFSKYKEKIDKYGGYFILFGNILPGPIEFISVFFGGFKFNFKRYIFLTFMGRLIKYIIIFLLFHFFWDTLIFSYNDFINNAMILKDLYI